jgi:hypothetical protein
MKIPTTDELCQIAITLKEKLPKFNFNDIEVTFKVDKNMLKKVNEDLFFRNNPEADSKDLVNNPDEIVVDIVGVMFKYIEKI